MVSVSYLDMLAAAWPSDQQKWPEAFIIPAGPADNLRIKVYDSDHDSVTNKTNDSKNDFLGECELSISQLAPANGWGRTDVNLTGKKAKGIVTISATR